MHGSAPDIAGQDLANPLAMVLSAAMMCRYGLNMPQVRKDLQCDTTKKMPFQVKLVLSSQGMLCAYVCWLPCRYGLWC